MKHQLSLLISSSLALLTGCTSTYSFAPPQVNVSKSVIQEGQNGCNLKSSDNSISTPSLNSARLMIDNFVFSYRCAATQLADGKRDFDIPALLAGVGGAAAAALGTGRDVAIATGTTAALFSGAKGYFAPQDKARIVSGGLDALLCIKTEAVGITALEVGRVEDAAVTKMRLFSAQGVAPPPSVNFSAARQYYELVTSALLSVENVMLQRLASIGSYAPDAIISEINAVAKKLDDAKDKKKEDDAVNTAKTLSGDMPTQIAIASTIVKLNELQPKLQACVIRAKT